MRTYATVARFGSAWALLVGPETPYQNHRAFFNCVVENDGQCTEDTRCDELQLWSSSNGIEKKKLFRPVPAPGRVVVPLPDINYQPTAEDLADLSEAEAKDLAEIGNAAPLSPEELAELDEQATQIPQPDSGPPNEQGVSDSPDLGDQPSPEPEVVKPKKAKPAPRAQTRKPRATKT